jgi:nitroreductase
MTDPRQLWLVDDANYPAGESKADVLRFALRYAVLAPSSHNSQPWLFYVDGNAVEIYAIAPDGCQWSTLTTVNSS